MSARRSRDLPTWVGTTPARVAEVIDGLTAGGVADQIEAFARANQATHDRDCLNLNPATNTMNPRAEAMLAAGLGARPSLGHPGEKYEMGLEAAEAIEVAAAELACRVFDADHAEIRLASGAMANLAAFMSCCAPGDTIVVPPATIGGHVTHNTAGAAGLYGLRIVEAPIDPETYSVDVDRLGEVLDRERPAMVTVGASLNLTHHPVAEMAALTSARSIPLLFDAAHLSGPIAGGAWPNPLAEGADVMTMSTYKSLAGPPAGLLVTNDTDLAARVDAVVFPGLTANFDVAKSAALAITLADWLATGDDHARAMVDDGARLAAALESRGLPVFRTSAGPTRSHAFALDTTPAHHPTGDAAARHLRLANLLTCAIGLPADGDGVMRGLRLGTNELVRWGMGGDHLDTVADLITRAWHADETTAVALAAETAAFRRSFDDLAFCAD